MAQFFNKIRQQLLSEQRLSKYLLYSLGEIVLVVIGILIALAINNNSQEQSLRKREQTYLNGLKAEFQISKVKLDELIRLNRLQYNGAKQMLTYISNKQEHPTEQAFSELIYNTFSADLFFNPNNSLLNEMINTGSLKDISNSALRVQLTNWLSTLDDVYKQENDLDAQREELLDLFRTNEYSLRTVLSYAGVSEELSIPKKDVPSSSLELLNALEFENKLLMFILTSHGTEKAHYDPLLQDLDHILELIDQEIK